VAGFEVIDDSFDRRGLDAIEQCVDASLLKREFVGEYFHPGADERSQLWCLRRWPTAKTAFWVRKTVTLLPASTSPRASS
jgi:hypothetical protein